MPSVFSVKEVKTIEYPVQYIQQPSANTDYQKNITIESPDGIERILSLEAFMKGDFQAGTNIRVRIRHPNGTLLDCNPSQWTTPNQDIADYDTVFDCSDLIKEFSFTGGDVEAGFRLSKVAQNVNIRLVITYLNKPDVEKEDIFERVEKTPFKMDFYGTEYIIGDTGTIWLQLLRNYQPLNNVTCYVTAYFPVNHSKFLDNVLMNYLSGSDGIYYYDLTIPNYLGVYMLSARCNMPIEAWSDDFIDWTKIEASKNVTVSGSVVKLNPSTSGVVDEDSPQLILLYHFDNNSAYGENNSFVHDFSGYDHYGVPYSINVKPIPDGKFNGAYNFSGSSSDYVNVTQKPSLNVTEGLTISAWVRLSKFSNSWSYILYLKDTYGIEFGTYNSIYEDGFHCKLKNTAGSSFDLGSPDNEFPLSVGQWYHVVCVRNGTFLGVYVNGTLVDSRNDFSGDLYGGSYIRVGYKYYGDMDELAIWNRSLSPAEIMNLYSESANYTKGYVQSIPVTLGGGNWLDFSADYDLKDGSINFFVLDQNNNTICSGLGNISSCAGTTSPIKLFANITRPYPLNDSPEIDRWYLVWTQSTIEEIRGAGELHVSPNVSVNVTVNTTDILENLTIQISNQSSYVGGLIISHNSSIWGKLYLIQDELANITDLVINSTNTTLAQWVILNEINETVHNITCDGGGNFTCNTTYLEQLIISHNATVINELINITDLIINATNTTIAHNSSIWTKLYLIQDELAEINETVHNITLNTTELENLIISHNTTVMEKLHLIQEEIANQTIEITQNITIQLNDLRSFIETWFLSIQGDIYNLQQQWIDIINQFLTQLLGGGQQIQRIVGQTTGVTPTEQCGLLDRILGKCP